MQGANNEKKIYSVAAVRKTQRRRMREKERWGEGVGDMVREKKSWADWLVKRSESSTSVSKMI